MINLSLKFFLAGLLLNPVLINIIGFLSPFWTAFVLDNKASSFNLLSIFQPFAPFVSVLFAYALFTLTKIVDQTWLKVICIMTCVIYVCTSFYGFLAKDEMSYIIISSTYSSMESIMLILAGVIILFKSRALDESLLPSNAV